MMSCFGHMIKTLLVHILNNGAYLNSLSLNRENCSVPASVQHVKSVHGLTCSESFENGISALYGIFVFISLE